MQVETPVVSGCNNSFSFKINSKGTNYDLLWYNCNYFTLVMLLGAILMLFMKIIASNRKQIVSSWFVDCLKQSTNQVSISKSGQLN